ncbi:MAG: hypothetical protein JW876_07600 [Candidatus Krumholzibacteriota bacterium]|nr:hypothetical protein [Candidatus Krumholzibacteriota bacterium]
MAWRPLISACLLVVSLGCAGAVREPAGDAAPRDVAAWEDAGRRSAIGEPEAGRATAGNLRLSVSGGGTPRREALCRLDAKPIDGAFRVRSEERFPNAWYARGRIFGGRLSIVAGDISPRAGQGLVLGGGRSDYPFSADYAAARTGEIAPRASWWGEMLRGGAVEVAGSSWTATAWTARQRAWRGGVPVSLPERATAIHLGHGAGCASFGFVLVGGTAVGGTLSAVECRLREGGVRGVLEIAATARDVAWAAGVRRRGSFELSVLLYGAPHGFDSPLGRLPGGALGGGALRRGCSAVAGKRVAGGVLSAAVERMTEADAIEEAVDIDRRVEWRLERRRWGLAAAARWRHETERKTHPWPGPGPERVSDRESLALRCRWAPWRRFDVALAMRAAREGSDDAVYAAPSIACGLFAGAMLRIAAAWWRGSGNVPLYLYERTVEGRYPWQALRGSGRRGTAAFSVRGHCASMAVWLAVEKGRGAEGGATITIFRR